MTRKARAVKMKTSAYRENCKKGRRAEDSTMLSVCEKIVRCNVGASPICPYLLPVGERTDGKSNQSYGDGLAH